MKKLLQKIFIHQLFPALAGIIITNSAWSQTPTDMQFVAAGNVCAGVSYSYNSWNHYWEGTRLINNDNVGTVSTQKYGVGFALGITDYLNVMVKAPYALTKASSGTLNGQTDLEDLYVHVKAKFCEPKLGKGKIKLAGDLGFSTPLTHYLIDFAPLNCGSGTTNLSYRQIVHYHFDNGFYFGGKANYTYRSNIPDIHREFYYDNGAGYYNNEVFVPNVFDWIGTVGFANDHLLAELDYMSANSLGGTDIAIWEPGFPTNNVDYTTISARFDYFFNKPDGLNITASAGYTLSGRNAGQSMFGSIGVNYLFALWHKKETVK